MGEPTGASAESLLTDYSGRLANLLAVGGFLAFLGRGLVPPLVPAIVDDLGISLSAAGFGLSVMWVSYAVSHYPGGRLADRLTRKTPLIGSFALLVAGFGVLSLVATYAAFLVGVAFVGVGMGVYMPASRGLVADLFVDRRAQALGVQIAASSAGSAAAAGVAVGALAVATWQTAFLPSVVGLAVVGIAMHRWSREPYRVERVELEAMATVHRLLADRRMVAIAATYCLFAIAWLGVLSFLPAFLHATKGISLARASAVYALFFVAGVVGSPLSGGLADRLPRLTVAAGAVVVAGTGLVGLLVFDSLVPVAAGVALFGAGSFGVPPVMQSLVLDSFQDTNMAGDFGALKTVYTAVGALAPAFTGFVADRWGYPPAFWTFVGCLLVTLVGLFVVRGLSE